MRELRVIVGVKGEVVELRAGLKKVVGEKLTTGSREDNDPDYSQPSSDDGEGGEQVARLRQVRSEGIDFEQVEFIKSTSGVENSGENTGVDVRFHREELEGIEEWERELQGRGRGGYEAGDRQGVDICV